MVVHWLAVHRATQLWTADRIMRTPRVAATRAIYTAAGRDDHINGQDDATVDEFARDDGDRPYLAELFHCQWCVSVWAAVVLGIARRHRAGRAIEELLAASTVAVIVHDVIAKLTKASK